MTYEQAKVLAQRCANNEGVEYGVRKADGDNWQYCTASWYAARHKEFGWSLDDIELVLPLGSDDVTWPEVAKKWDEYDPTPNGSIE